MQATPVNPPVVLSKGKVTLADHLDLKNLPLGTTPGGVAFCLKALHPSEHTIKSARIPGGNKMSVALCSDGVYDIPLTNANSRIELALGANPVILGCAAVSHATGGSFTSDGKYDIFNAAFSGGARPCMELNPTPTKITDYTKDFSDKVSEYRITSQSVTAELIAPALSDQGTITACQYNTAHSDGTLQLLDGGSSPYYQILSRDWVAVQQPLGPGQAILGTNAYTSKAREGVYMPLKLAKLKWYSAGDLVVPFERSASQMAEDYSSHGSNTPIVFPYYCDRTACTKWSNLDYVPRWCGYNFGLVVFDGLAAGTTVRFRFRQVVEITARPSTPYAPLLENALPPDSTALKMYAEISARMADAYPASYNDLGKLKDFIMKVGRAVQPYVEPALSVISKIPGPLGMIGTGVKAVAPVVTKLITSGSQQAPVKKKAASSAKLQVVRKK